MLEGKKFGVISLGCDKNRVDTEKMIARLKERGVALTDDLSETQILIVNTCAFLEASRKEAIETVLESNAYRSGTLEKIVMTGCLPEKFIDELYDAFSEVDVFLGINDYDLLFDALEKSYRENARQNFVHCGQERIYTKRVLTTEKHVAYLKIADGCYNHCTYCLIPKIRGKYRSYPMDALKNEAEELGEITELILVAQDTTRYGEDLYGENKFVELIKTLSELENIRSIRLLYCYPEMIDDRLIEEIKTNEKVIKYLDIPLQHSEDGILKKMNRKGTRKSYLSLIEKLRKEIPEIAIRSTFICGFPSETEEDHENLKSFLEEARLVNCGFFAYSKEKDTPAYKMQGHLKNAVKTKRVRALYSVQKEISKSFLRSFVGKSVEVVCDGIDFDKKCFVGRAYFSAPEIDGKVYFNAPHAVQGEKYKIKIKRADAYDMFGATEDYER